MGDMGEVGAAGPRYREIGAYAREQGVTRLYATGDLAREAVAAFGAGATPSTTCRRSPLLQRDAHAGSRCWSRARASCGWARGGALTGQAAEAGH
jgi:hypothetical protein